MFHLDIGESIINVARQNVTSEVRRVVIDVHLRQEHRKCDIVLTILPSASIEPWVANDGCIFRRSPDTLQSRKTAHSIVFFATHLHRDLAKSLKFYRLVLIILEHSLIFGNHLEFPTSPTKFCKILGGKQPILPKIQQIKLPNFGN